MPAHGTFSEEIKSKLPAGSVAASRSGGGESLAGTDSKMPKTRSGSDTGDSLPEIVPKGRQNSNNQTTETFTISMLEKEKYRSGSEEKKQDKAVGAKQTLIDKVASINIASMGAKVRQMDSESSITSQGKEKKISSDPGIIHFATSVLRASDDFSVAGICHGSSVSLGKNSNLVAGEEYSGTDLRDEDGNNIDQALANLRRRRVSHQSSAIDSYLDTPSTQYSKIMTNSSLDSSGNRSDDQPRFLTQHVVAEPLTQQSSSEAMQVSFSDFFHPKEARSSQPHHHASTTALKSISIQSSNIRSQAASDAPDYYVTGVSENGLYEADSIRLIRKTSKQLKHKDESLTSITGIIYRDSTDFTASELSFNDKQSRDRRRIPERSFTGGGINENKACSSATGRRLSSLRLEERPKFTTQNRTGSVGASDQINSSTLAAPNSASPNGSVNSSDARGINPSYHFDSKTKLKGILNSRKSLAPDSTELAAMSTAKKTVDEPPELEPKPRKPRIVATVEEVNESTHLLTQASKKESFLTKESRMSWRKLIQVLKWGNMIYSGGKTAMGNILKLTCHISFPEDTASIQSFLSELDYVSKVQELLSIPTEKRTVDVIQRLDRILKPKVLDYSKMTESDRYHLCRIMRLEKHKKDTVLHWEEHPLTDFHIILVGKVEIFKLHKNQKIPLMIMNDGTIIGHARAKVTGATRTSCAIISSYTILLAIDKDKYINRAESKNFIWNDVIDPRAHPLERKCVLFQKTPSFFSKAALYFEYQVYNRGDIIQAQGKAIDYLFFILKGTCRVTRSVPFSCKSQNGKSALHPYPEPSTFEPLTNPKVQHEEKIHWINLQTQDDLGLYDWFPYLPQKVERHHSALAETLHPAIVDKDVIYRSGISDLSDYTITVTDEEVLTARISLDDLVDVSSQAAIANMISFPSVHRYGIKQLQEKYLQDRAREQQNVINGM